MIDTLLAALAVLVLVYALACIWIGDRDLFVRVRWSEPRHIIIVRLVRRKPKET